LPVIKAFNVLHIARFWTAALAALIAYLIYLAFQPLRIMLAATVFIFVFDTSTFNSLKNESAEGRIEETL
jgi:fatty acid desaturase